MGKNIIQNYLIPSLYIKANIDLKNKLS